MASHPRRHELRKHIHALLHLARPGEFQEKLLRMKESVSSVLCPHYLLCVQQAGAHVSFMSDIPCHQDKNNTVFFLSAI